MALVLSYALFVYAKRDEEIIRERKAFLGVLITVVWFFIVCIRIHQYWRDITQVGFEDMVILIFSVVFTIPTIYEWLKNIPKK